jgi:2-polyprenyl-3-methyl-5-hydroxy-6-metoxy-1,4-benzoquinol methylase
VGLGVLSDDSGFLAIPRKPINDQVTKVWIMTSQHQLVQSYDIVASQWRAKIEGLGYAAAYRWMVEICGIQSEHVNVIDIGCGTGDFSRALIEVAGPPNCLTLLDPAEQMVRTATRSLIHIAPRLKPLVAKLEDKPQQRHDVILCAHVIEHFADLGAALSLLKSYLAPDGTLLLVVSKPHWCNWIIWTRWRHRWVRPTRMLDLFAQAGLSCEWDASFPAGPPSRSSHAYLVKHL